MFASRFDEDEMSALTQEQQPTFQKMRDSVRQQHGDADELEPGGDRSVSLP